MVEYIQSFEKDGREMTMYFDFCSERYVIWGYGLPTYRFTDIYDAYDFMKREGWE